MGTRTENQFCGTTLFAGSSDRSARCQHTGCPLTLAMRQMILRHLPVLSALGGPFADPLFAPLSALRHSLWMRCQLYFRVCGLPYDMFFIQQKCPFVKYEIAQTIDKPNPEAVKFPFSEVLQRTIPSPGGKVARPSVCEGKRVGRGTATSKVQEEVRTEV